MQIGMIGLGRMGANMVRRLARGGHECVAFDQSQTAVQALAADGAKGDAGKAASGAKSTGADAVASAKDSSVQAAGTGSAAASSAAGTASATGAASHAVDASASPTRGVSAAGAADGTLEGKGAINSGKSAVPSANADSALGARMRRCLILRQGSIGGQCGCADISAARAIEAVIRRKALNFASLASASGGTYVPPLLIFASQLRASCIRRAHSGAISGGSRRAIV